MKPLYNLLLASSIGLMSYCTPNIAQNSNSINDVSSNSHSNIYDSKKSRFITSPGGISESYLNLTHNSIFKEDLYLNYLNYVDSLERTVKFAPLDSTNWVGSFHATQVTAAYDSKLIFNVDNTPLDSLRSELFPLKLLLTGLNDINSFHTSSVEKLRLMYDLTNEFIHRGNRTSSSVPIDILTQGFLGDCNDLVPAYYSLFSYYGFDTRMRFSKILNSKNKFLGLHTWIDVNLNALSIDLDPTYYNIFAPLEDRCDSALNTHLSKKSLYTKKDFATKSLDKRMTFKHYFK